MTRICSPRRARVLQWKKLVDGRGGGMNISYVIIPRRCFMYRVLTGGKVQLVELSMQQKDALTVLLTGRSEAGFGDIIKRMVTSRKLNFDLVCLKPEAGPNNQRFSSTMNFKQTLLEDLVLTYKQADEIRIYEDRVKQLVDMIHPYCAGR